MGIRDKLIVKADSFFCATINGLRFAASCFDVRGNRLLKKNESLKLCGEKAVENQACFILGNGPSLNADVVKSIAKYPIFTVNFFHKANYGVSSTYHVMVDAAFSDYVNRPEIAHYAKELTEKEENTKFIFSMKSGAQFRKKDSIPQENIYFIKTLSQYGSVIRTDMCRPMTAGPNVIPEVIQCAIYMGYKQIYLLGCEFGLYGLPGPGTGHHYSRPQEADGFVRSCDSPECLIRCGLVHAHHNAIVKYCREKGITIQNLTPISNLGQYDSDTLENIISKIEANDIDGK